MSGQSNGESELANGESACSQQQPPLTTRMAQFLQQIDWSFRRSGAEQRSVIDFTPPEKLLQSPWLQLQEEAVGEDELERRLQDVYRHSVTSNHPHFYNQLFGRVSEESLAASLVTDAINTSLYTYEVAPVFTVMEQLVVQRLLRLFGFESGDGIGCPGGSIGNMYGLNLARSKAFPECRVKGVVAMPPVRIYVSDEGHYSANKGAAFMGLGEESVTTVPTDERGIMRTDTLRDSIRNDIAAGRRPLMVIATAGTTVAGAFDPFDKIADICEEFGAWMHVDACFGGALALSEKHKHLLHGCHRADSLTWNPHKTLGVNLQCSFLLTRHAGSMQSAHGTQAAYLFQQDKCYDLAFDVGDAAIQCGRKVDVLKLWATWQGFGRRGLEQLVDRKLRLAQRLAEMLRARPDSFELLLEPQLTNVMFFFVPPSLRGLPRDAEWRRRLDESAPAIKRQMMLQGSVMVGHQRSRLAGGINCWRMVCSQAANTEADLRFLIDEFERLGAQINV